MNWLIAVLLQLQDELRELVDLGETVQMDWSRAGLDPHPVEPENPEAASHLRYAEEMVADADRFDWAVRAYISELQSFVVRRRPGRTGGTYSTNHPEPEPFTRI